MTRQAIPQKTLENLNKMVQDLRNYLADKELNPKWEFIYNAAKNIEANLAEHRPQHKRVRTVLLQRINGELFDRWVDIPLISPDMWVSTDHITAHPLESIYFDAGKGFYEVHLRAVETDNKKKAVNAFYSACEVNK